MQKFWYAKKYLQYYCDIGNIANTDILLVHIGYDFIGASTAP
jgi:hypothetical protein